jgi:hypothetical protein
MDAASALDVREVDFFRLSYRRWFGRDVRARDLERVFSAYMFRQDVPSWVRHFSREVLTLAERGRLDPARLGALQFKRQPPPHPNGRVYVGATLAVIVFFCAALVNAGRNPETIRPLPCYGGPGLKLASDLAHAIGGRSPPSCAPMPGVR